MSAILNPNVIVDSLVPVVDSLRTVLYPLAGVRQFTLAFVTRTWDGEAIGEGRYTDSVVVANTQCRVDAWELQFKQEACGQMESGTVSLSEISLQYSWADVTGGELNARQQFFVRLSEAHGQAQPVRYFVHKVAPLDDREHGIGWKFVLELVHVPDGDA